MDDEDGFDGSSPAEAVSALLARCTVLLTEIAAFKASIAEHEAHVDINPYQSLVKSEHRSLEKTLQTAQTPSLATDPAPRLAHALRSSNLPYLEAVWTAARSTTGIVAFHRRFRWPARGRRPEGSVLVDVVARNGAEWIKVSTLGEKRLLFELARAGQWDDGDDDDDSDGDGAKVSALQENGRAASPQLTPSDDGDDEEDGDEGGVSLLRLAEDLRRGAAATRVRYRRPAVRFVLPRIAPGSSKPVDGVLAELARTGATVSCGGGDAPPPSSGFGPLLPSAHPPLTADVNLDCTILLALVSDVSHGTLSDAAVHPAVARQVELEAKKPLLRAQLYPALRGRRLHTAEAAARRMREIIGTIGTDSERARAEILLAEGPAVGLGAENLEARWGGAGVGMEAAAAPKAAPGGEVAEEGAGLMLPVRVVSEAAAAELERAAGAGVARRAARLQQEVGMSEVNRGVWMLGWATGWITLTSNRAVARAVEEALERALLESDDDDGGRLGPDVWVCATARSLLGKEMVKKGAPS